MGQVPPKFAIIGNGRMACHLRHYFQMLGLPFSTWYRQGLERSLIQSVTGASHVLLAINDDAIDSFIRTHPCLEHKTLVHFSGALDTPLAYGVHPLCTFGEQLYPLNRYLDIPLIQDTESPSLESLLPGVPNPSYRIPKQARALYHALCVMGGNFTTLLWQKAFSGLEELGVPQEALIPYLRQTCDNLCARTGNPLTGPLARGDQHTLDRHLTVLDGDPFRRVYEAFVEAYQEDRNWKPQEIAR